MGFFTFPTELRDTSKLMSQSLSGWDGVFYWYIFRIMASEGVESQSLSGWDGVFYRKESGKVLCCLLVVAIPFRVGWGFLQCISLSR